VNIDILLKVIAIREVSNSLTYIGEVRPQGNSGRVYPALPKETLGKKVIITIIENDAILEPLEREG